MPSVIDLCNRALDKLGQKPITSFDDTSKSAKVCNRNWPRVRDLNLRSHPWNFAVKRETLAPLTESPDWGFDYQHPLPPDCLRVLEVYDLKADEYEIEAGKDDKRCILTDASEVSIRYIKRVEDPNKYDDLFMDVVVNHLAIDSCITLTGSNTKKKQLLEEHKQLMLSAKSVDGQENPVSLFEEDEWITARY
jgi:hypothetical protein